MKPLTNPETYPGLFELLFSALSTEITPATEQEVRRLIMDWLSRNEIAMQFVYENEHPITFLYADGKAMQIRLILEHNDLPITVIAGIPPSDVVREISPINDTADVSEHPRWPIQ